MMAVPKHSETNTGATLGAALREPPSKRKASAYRFGCSPDWLKRKSANAPAVKREAEEEWTSS